MIELHETTLVAGPPGRVFDLARSIDVHLLGNTHSGEQATAGTRTGLIGPGESVTWRARHFLVRQSLTSQITRYDRPGYFQDTMLRGAFKSMQHDHYFEAVPGAGASPTTASQTTEPQTTDLQTTAAQTTAARTTAAQTTDSPTTEPQTTDSQTSMRDVFRFAAPLGPLGWLAERLVLRRYMRALLRERNRVIAEVGANGEWRKYVPDEGAS